MAELKPWGKPLWGKIPRVRYGCSLWPELKTPRGESSLQFAVRCLRCVAVWGGGQGNPSRRSASTFCSSITLPPAVWFLSPLECMRMPPQPGRGEGRLPTPRLVAHHVLKSPYVIVLPLSAAASIAAAVARLRRRCLLCCCRRRRCCCRCCRCSCCLRCCCHRLLLSTPAAAATCAASYHNQTRQRPTLPRVGQGGGPPTPCLLQSKAP